MELVIIINDPYVFLTLLKNMNVKVFNLISRSNEIRYIKWHKTCQCKCRLAARVCNNKQRWNEDYLYYLDYKNCRCRKKLLDKLVEECRKNIDEKKLHQNKMIYNSNLNDYEKICSSYIVYIILFVTFFIISISIRSVFIYFHWYLERKYIETTIY